MTKLFTLHAQLQQDTIELTEFPLCKLLLCNDSNYPWFIVKVWVKHLAKFYIPG